MLGLGRITPVRPLPTILQALLPSPRALILAMWVVTLHSSMGGGAWAQEPPDGGASVQDDGDDRDESSGRRLATSQADSERDVRLSDRGELERIIELYMSGQYAACSAQLSKFIDPRSDDPFEDSRVLEEGRLYYASCTLLEGRRDEARKALRKALEENPLMPSPDSLTFPPPVVSLFLEVRDEVQQLIADSEKEQVVRLRRENELARRRAEQREYRERELEKLAQKEFLVARNSRYIASVPFGVGQFQNGNNVLGGVFLAAEGLLLATAVGSGVILADLTADAADGDGEVVDVVGYNEQRDAAHRTLTWSSWALLGTAALGVFEAQLNFKRERLLKERKRALPPELEVRPEPEPGDSDDNFELEPSVGLAPGGGVLGVRGTF